ncbi:AMP-binding protein [Sphingomonas sp. LY54]|uniref:AMP-binding protein n=1 Tax=Sphingomonas sp. LY54 TaxID=3095343 RepID=UPI002D79C06C|nr:AMP-binding protein [Sphingomonas sp. LY54]WRP29221.1 AMP-binding protein [Sphingomonas sp. LY54]
MIGSLPDLIARRALLGPDRIALEQGDRTITYAELDRRAAAAAALMAERGVGEGDRVAILSRNRIAFFEILFGCAKLGAILVPLNWRMPQPELDQLLDDCEPVLLFREGGAGDLRDRLPTIDLDADYEDCLARAPAITVRRAWPEDATWYLLYTSGTTGRPKGVIYTFRMALANAVNIGTAIDLRSTDTTLCFLPHFHTAGINLHSLPTLFAGGRVIVLESFEPEEIVQLLEARRLDALFAVPTVYQALVEHPRFAGAPLDHVRHWGCGGAPLPDRLVERYKPIGVRICNGMGMTETGPTAFLLDPADAWSRIGSVGKPQLLCGVRIVDEEGREVADGEVGDLLFGGPAVTPGYWRNPEANAAAFTSDGWLRSGDLVRRDGDGFHYVVGRRKEMFISGGANIYPAEIENVLAAHPEVAEAAVVAAPDPYWGEIGQAFVLPIDGASLTAADLEAHCRASLAGYKVPRRFEIVADFPRTAAGKIQKHRLAPFAEAGAVSSAG